MEIVKTTTLGVLTSFIKQFLTELRSESYFVGNELSLRADI